MMISHALCTVPVYLIFLLPKDGVGPEIRKDKVFKAIVDVVERLCV